MSLRASVADTQVRVGYTMQVSQLRKTRVDLGWKPLTYISQVSAQPYSTFSLGGQ